MKPFLPLLSVCLLLTGCTDIRTRLSPDLLAAETGTPCRFAAHTTQEDRVITAEAASPLLFPDALQNASGAEISAGHLSLLAVSGNPCTVMQELLQNGLLAPTCPVLFVPQHACDKLVQDQLPDPARLQAAADTGQIPVRTADIILGDLWEGSGITAIPVQTGETFSLSLWDTEQQYAVLSESACRGLALLCGRWQQFRFHNGQTVCSVTKQALRCTVSGTASHLCFTFSGKLSVSPPTDGAAEILTAMLREAFEQTAGASGADLLFLRETAARDGISEASACTPSEWRCILKNADCRIQITA